MRRRARSLPRGRLVARLVEQPDVELLDRGEPPGVLLGLADPGVEGPAGVAGEAGGPPRPRLELGVTRGSPSSSRRRPSWSLTSAFIGYRISARTAGAVKEPGVPGGLAGELGQHRQQERLRLAGAGAGGDGQAHAVARGPLQRLRLVGVRRVVQDALQLPGRSGEALQKGPDRRVETEVGEAVARLVPGGALDERRAEQDAFLFQQGPALLDQRGVADVVGRLDVVAQGVLDFWVDVSAIVGASAVIPPPPLLSGASTACLARKPARPGMRVLGHTVREQCAPGTLERPSR